MKLVWLYLFPAITIAQPLPDASPPGLSGTTVLVIGGIMLLIGLGLFGYSLYDRYKAKPATSTSAATVEISADTTKLHQALLDAESHIAGFAERAKAHLTGVADAATAATTAVPASTPAPDPLQPQLEAANDKLARIKAIVDG